ncbi:Uncharacterized protein Fot_49816 [Forsythia ovata]|uniref:Uncharacterized protein n=1 Tax=Forsythia ovata TaxID=205694 RepID=A0ABD1QCY0_9LAMI
MKISVKLVLFVIERKSGATQIDEAAFFDLIGRLWALASKFSSKRRLRISDRRLRVSDRRFSLLGIYYPPAQKLIVKRRLFISDRRLRISGRRLCRIRNILFADRYLRSDHSRPIVSLIPVHLLVVEAQFPSVRSVSVVMGTERE